MIYAAVHFIRAGYKVYERMAKDDKLLRDALECRTRDWSTATNSNAGMLFDHDRMKEELKITQKQLQTSESTIAELKHQLDERARTRAAIARIDALKVHITFLAKLGEGLTSQAPRFHATVDDLNKWKKEVEAWGLQTVRFLSSEVSPSAAHKWGNLVGLKVVLYPERHPEIRDDLTKLNREISNLYEIVEKSDVYLPHV